MGQPRDLESSERLFDHPFLSLRCDVFADPDRGTEKRAILVEISDWVNVVAVDEVGRVLLVRQFRYGTRQLTDEIPGGAVDRGETPLVAARRELMEETGYQADDWREIGTVEPNPAIQGNRCTTFLARGLRAAGSFDVDEIDEIEWVDFAALRRRIRNGTIRHALVIAAVYFAVDALAEG